ncbi:helix-turn-helix transcriptional regulator [Limosilactobacillus fermentum]|uniref:helix-turn-helix domain-containing protein n=1 Tax=Limosilactobacillus fermentum TaxID=1613 RepID=UPI00124B2819|nr:helix-turn-helix transcriptional regulator [Limosilactobacillus fermentum]KAB1962474.1 helix-turn-helix transcriptional regulator [Limosilactobacillus fermentum]MCJ2387583.1 helix-turn-helix transcriptional regulator [Limosilactobacillus fermentum]MCT3455146.1 XRE family transcriptional regulator [Limosilactobacillus fermentum]MCT3461270.1 XRE family transcriptional regulator [Limosilactobacillus fermentum]WJD85286.1 helix-turn-helix transcriptional regulator [Limosilactobacillus fermentum]
MNSEEILRKNVTRLREQRGWSIQELASRLNIDRTYLSKSESGKRSFKVSEVNRLAELFGVSVDYLLGRPEKNDNNNTADLADDDTIFTYKGQPLSDDDKEIIRRLMNGK